MDLDFWDCVRREKPISYQKVNETCVDIWVILKMEYGILQLNKYGWL